MKKYSPEGSGLGDERAKPASNERPEIVQINQNRTSDANIERATGNGTTVSDTISVVNSDSNRTQIMKP